MSGQALAYTSDLPPGQGHSILDAILSARGLYEEMTVMSEQVREYLQAREGDI